MTEKKDLTETEKDEIIKHRNLLLKIIALMIALDLSVGAYSDYNFRKKIKEQQEQLLKRQNQIVELQNQIKELVKEKQ